MAAKKLSREFEDLAMNLPVWCFPKVGKPWLLSLKRRLVARLDVLILTRTGRVPHALATCAHPQALPCVHLRGTLADVHAVQFGPVLVDVARRGVQCRAALRCCGHEL